jgi:hypothetical protein
LVSFSMIGKEAWLKLLTVINVIRTKSIFFIKQRKVNNNELLC